MGLRIDENQRKQLEEASYKVPTLTHAATNPANNIVSVDNFDADYLMQYIENGGKKNYQSMLAYIRKFIDGKKFMAPEPERVNERPDYLLTHFDPKDEKGDELGFNSIREYNAFLAKNGLYKKGAYRLNLRHNDIGAVFLYDSRQSVAVKHVEHLVLVGSIAPDAASHLFVQLLCRGFSQPVAECLCQRRGSKRRK